MVPVSEQRKAIVSCLIALLSSLGLALSDGTVTWAEWVGVALATVVAYGAVYGIENKDAK